MTSRKPITQKGIGRTWEKTAALIEKALAKSLGAKVTVDDGCDVVLNYNKKGEVVIGSVEIDENKNEWTYTPCPEGDLK